MAQAAADPALMATDLAEKLVELGVPFRDAHHRVGAFVKYCKDRNCALDEVTLEEMQTFVRNEEYRAEAEDGAHDDCVMALAIAHFIRPHQDYLAAPEPGTAVEWTEDMWEDYRRASADERAMLLHRWGRPKE